MLSCSVVSHPWLRFLLSTRSARSSRSICGQPCITPSPKLWHSRSSTSLLHSSLNSSSVSFSTSSCGCNKLPVNSCVSFLSFFALFPGTKSYVSYSIFFLFVFTTNTTLKAFMRTLTAAIASEAGAQAVAGLSFMTMIIYTGYAIPKPSMIGALRWLTWINVCFLS